MEDHITAAIIAVLILLTVFTGTTIYYVNILVSHSRHAHRVQIKLINRVRSEVREIRIMIHHDMLGETTNDLTDTEYE